MFRVRVGLWLLGVMVNIWVRGLGMPNISEGPHKDGNTGMCVFVSA